MYVTIVRCSSDNALLLLTDKDGHVAWSRDFLQVCEQFEKLDKQAARIGLVARIELWEYYKQFEFRIVEVQDLKQAVSDILGDLEKYDLQRRKTDLGWVTGILAKGEGAEELFSSGFTPYADYSFNSDIAN